MENISKPANDGALLLTKHTFSSLLACIITHFKTSHGIDSCKDSQLYGFGNYNPDEPNLKNDLELILRGYVNGKYLYNKKREFASGKPIIKISREYKNLFFNYLGYGDIHEFLANEVKDDGQSEKQLLLLQNLSANQEFYYVMYYYGEDRKMTKGKLIIYNNWKTFEMVFVYLNTRNEYVLYDLFGTIKQENNFVHLSCKHFMEGKKIEGSKMIFYVGKASFFERPILIGSYSSFDKYDRSISGKIILMRMDTKAEMDKESKSLDFDPVICQELVKQRIIVPSGLPKKRSKISTKSAYASIYGKMPNTYRTVFSTGTDTISLDYMIQKNHYSIVSCSEDVELENDRVSVENKGQILELHFSIVGVFLLQRVSIYLEVYNLLGGAKKTAGHFSGVDINNKIVSGACTCQIL